ncbi:MAG: hypothetical protein ACRCX2_14540 [Paraclostridium sp.]
MRNSYKKLERDYLFEVDRGLQFQHNKIMSEVREVEDEVVSIPETNQLFFKTTLFNYVSELMDVQMAINNQLLRMEKEYGDTFLKNAMLEHDKKMEHYKEVKYAVTK